MAGTITPLGEMTVGSLVPTTLSLFGSYYSNLQAQAAAAGNLKAALNVAPPSVAAVGQITGVLQAGLQAVVRGPSLNAAIVVNAQALLAIQAQLQAIGNITAAFGEAGAFVYTYSGDAGSFGSTVQAQLQNGLPGGGPNDIVNAFIVVTSIPRTWDAIGKVLLT